ncbi:MAG: BF3164 family lipoprotein [Lentimicrobiaceae bacterium]|nr:BF3164 family lipoprotein [Lentimicrobiaceae bacterium]
MRHIQFLAAFLFLMASGCGNNNENKTEIIQNERDRIIDVSDKIVDIKTDYVLGRSSLYIIDNVLIAQELDPKGETVDHLFDLKTFKYITSTGVLGRGPGEITMPSGILVDREKRVFWQLDVGKKVLHKFPLDSALSNKLYKPTVSVKLVDTLSLVYYSFLNDSIALGKAIEPFSGSPFVTMAMTKFNINTGEIRRFGYENTKVKGKFTNSYFALSAANGIYVNCYLYKDLMTVCDLNGNLKYNVYGPGWEDPEEDDNGYFHSVVIHNNKIFASYHGNSRIIVEGNIQRGSYPQRIIVFGLDGSYQQTIETGSEICRFCIDAKNNRIIAYFNDREEPLGYFDIPEL